MCTWLVDWVGSFDEQTMLATIVELGGKWEEGRLIASERHPQYICRRLAENMSGPHLVRLVAV
jgi:hypothetical protein